MKKNPFTNKAIEFTKPSGKTGTHKQTAKIEKGKDLRTSK